jgi:hypothetical protein
MDSKAVVARFDQERQALAVMNRPHLAKVLDFDASNPVGRPPLGRQWLRARKPPRRDAEWKMTANPKFVLLGNRGPFDGNPESTIPGSDPARKNTESLSILRHGEAGRWAGFTVTGDGSTRLVRTVTPPFLAPVRTGDTTAPDNLFREDGEPRTRGDVFLAIVRRCMDRDGATVSELSWD